MNYRQFFLRCISCLVSLCCLSACDNSPDGGERSFVGEGIQSVLIPYQISITNPLPVSKRSPFLSVQLPIHLSGYQSVTVSSQNQNTIDVISENVDGAFLTVKLNDLPPRAQQYIDLYVDVGRAKSRVDNEGWHPLESDLKDSLSKLSSSYEEGSLEVLQKISGLINGVDDFSGVYALAGLECRLGKECVSKDKVLWLVSGQDTLLANDKMKVIFDNPRTLSELIVLLSDPRVMLSSNIQVTLN